MLRQRHPALEMFAYDAAPPSHSESSQENTYHGRAKAWTVVSKGGVDRLSKHRSATLFLCYPPPDSDMALQALRAYTGDTVCYVGEYRGDTGSAKFEMMLECSYQCVEVVPLPNWGDTCYEMTVWSRIKCTPDAVIETLKHPARCTTCEVLKSRMYRCRLSYGVTFCSNECAGASRARHTDELTFKFLLHNNASTSSGERSSKKRRKLPLCSGSDNDVSATSTAEDVSPLFDVKSQFFSVLKVKCPWL